MKPGRLAGGTGLFSFPTDPGMGGCFRAFLPGRPRLARRPFIAWPRRLGTSQASGCWPRRANEATPAASVSVSVTDSLYMWIARNQAVLGCIGVVACALWRLVDDLEGDVFPRVISMVAMFVLLGCVRDATAIWNRSV